MKNEGAENSNINQRYHRASRHHGDIGMSTELQHVRGTINNNKYASSIKTRYSINIIHQQIPSSTQR
jgi:hypothetical protein